MFHVVPKPDDLVCIVPSYPKPLVKLPLIFVAICFELLIIPVLLGKSSFILLPSPCRKSASILPNDPVDVTEPLISPLKVNPLLNEPLIREAICAEPVTNPVGKGRLDKLEPSP